MSGRSLAWSLDSRRSLCAGASRWGGTAAERWSLGRRRQVDTQGVRVEPGPIRACWPRRRCAAPSVVADRRHQPLDRERRQPGAVARTGAAWSSAGCARRRLRAGHRCPGAGPVVVADRPAGMARHAQAGVVAAAVRQRGGHPFHVHLPHRARFLDGGQCAANAPARSARPDECAAVHDCRRAWPAAGDLGLAHTRAHSTVAAPDRA